MTDTLIGLVPEYGLMLVFVVVGLACLAVPVPSSILVLASGAFAAAGDLVAWQVALTSFAAFVIGDQIAFAIGAQAGSPLVRRLERNHRIGEMLERARDLLHRRGDIAVLMSHTVLSPTCPYVSYLCGAGGMRWRAFAGMATLGAAIWSLAYVALGYVFATQLAMVATILSHFFGLAITLTLIVLSGLYLHGRWQRHHRARMAQRRAPDERPVPSEQH